MNKKLILILVALLALTCSCMRRGRFRQAGGSTYRVAVLYSYDSLMPCYHQYDSVLEKTLDDADMKVELIRYYMDIPDLEQADGRWAHVLDSIYSLHPDLIITEGDLACYDIVLNHRSPGDTIPVVAGGLTALDWEVLRQDPNLYVWYDIPDYEDIMQRIMKLTGSNVILTELDDGYIDSLIQRQIHASLQAMPFINDTQPGYERLLAQTDTLQVPRDRMLVICSSYERPDTSLTANGTRSAVIENTRRLTRMACEYPQLEVKHDVSAHSAIHLGNKPEFTTLPYAFGHGGETFLAGYFVPMETEARDVATTVIALLKGKGGEVLRGQRHEAGAYMDYSLIGYYGIDLHEVKNDYEVINVPLEVRHPYYSGILIFMVFCLIVFSVMLIIYNYFIAAHNDLNTSLHVMPPSRFRLVSKKASIFHYIEGGMIEIDTYNQGEDTQHVTFSPEEFFAVVMPESHETALEFQEALHTPGRYSLELLVSFNGGRTQHWWRYRFLVSRPRKHAKCETVGVLMSIQEEKQHEQELRETSRIVQDMESRENFLNSMNHEIRTPLNVIMGCAQLLASDMCDINDKETQDLITGMQQNSERLMSLVQDILSYSRIGSGRMKYHLQPMAVEELMEATRMNFDMLLNRKPLLDENSIDKTGLLQLEYVPGTGGLFIDIDNTCIQQVFGHLMSNAIKFTDKGVIRLGWFYHITEDEVELYVEDCGAGIPDDKLDALWQIFYKQDALSSGLGLGLSLVRSMTEEMGGHVGIQSRIGFGSRFSLFFKPLRDIG